MRNIPATDVSEEITEYWSTGTDTEEKTQENNTEKIIEMKLS